MRTFKTQVGRIRILVNEYGVWLYWGREGGGGGGGGAAYFLKKNCSRNSTCNVT